MRSGFENKVRKYLTKHGVTFEYETEQLPYVVPSAKRKYTPDFIVTTPAGRKVYVESKGKFDTDARLKMLLVIEQHPDKDIRMLFMRDNPIRKGSKTRYSTWCEKHGVKYTVSEDGEVPKEWLED